MKQTYHIVVVGGGAGGLELVTRLGKKLGKAKKAKITLIDTDTTHLWKPLLHEVAAGTLDANEDELNYFVHASTHHYFFQLGKMVGLNRQKKEVYLDAIKDNSGQEIIPSRSINYDILVLALGSTSNDFGIPGVTKYCLFLDNRKQADNFQQIFLKKLLRLQNRTLTNPEEKLDIVIVGGGATGVELAAELHYTLELAQTYGLENIAPERDVKITLIEAASRILPVLPERISTLTTDELNRLGVTIYTDELVKEVSETHVITASGNHIKANIVVWAAGIKVDEVTKNLDGLEINRLNQILVKETLQTTIDKNIFAIGDCSSCPQKDNVTVPPRAQAASQEATLLAKSLSGYIKGESLLTYKYKDYGSLISLSKPSAFGDMMGGVLGRILLEGKIARLVYLSLYKKHQNVIYGPWKVILITIANILTRKIRAHLKLH